MSSMQRLNPLSYAVQWASGIVRNAFTRTVSLRSYEGGKDRRGDMGFDPILIGPNALADATLAKVVARSRWLADNNPVITGLVETVIANECGKMIYGIPTTEWEDLNEQIEDVIWAACEKVNPSRDLSLQQSQYLFGRERWVAGECLVYHPIAPAFGEFEAGPAIELFPFEQLGIGTSFVPAAAANRDVRQGVEFDQYKRRTGYWLYKDIPNDGGTRWFGTAIDPSSLQRIDAADATLSLSLKKIGQIRGIPRLVAAILTTRDMANYSEANIALAQAAASVGLYFEGVRAPTQLANTGDSDQAVDAQGRTIQELGPLMVGYMPKGGKVNMLSMNAPGPQFATVKESLTRDIGAGTGLSYGTVSRDRSRATFSSTRGELLDDRKTYQPDQQIIWDDHTFPYFRRVIKHAIRMGRITLTAEQRAVYLTDPRRILHALEPMFGGWDWVNPQQEAQATDLSIKTGVMDRETACAQRGLDAKDVIRRQCRTELFEKKLREQMGLPPREVVHSPNPVLPQVDDGDGTSEDVKKPDKESDDAE